MDPVSHVIFGRTLVAAVDSPDRSRFGRSVAGASILGALSPDVDALLMPQGWDIYLRTHEIGTHSLTGALLVGSAAGVLIRLLRGGRTPGLAVAGAIGAVSHVVLDLLSGARLQLAWPLSSIRSSLPLVAMADTWLIAVLACVAAALVIRRQRMQRTAWVALAVIAVFFGVKASLLARAHTTATRAIATASPVRLFEARWGSLHEWIVFERHDGALQAWLIDAWRQDATLQLAWPVLEESPGIAASRRLATVRNFLDVHDLTFAVEERDQAGGRHVWWSDVRYCWKPDAGGNRIDCGLWFGGLFDPDGRAVMQGVRLGNWTQTRPLTP
jgi:membrane-bound metal-dependent hydrolase YbcI (DUF457 family)